MLENIIMGFAQFSPLTYGLIIVGVFVGLVFGCMPGLSATTAITIAIPMSLVLDPVSAFALFMAMFVGGCSGGCISAILLGIPGTPSNLATTFDGFPLAKRGEPGKALGIAIFCSFIGTFVSISVLFLLAEPLSRVAIKLGPIQLFGMLFFALSLVSVLAGGNLAKSWIVALLGIYLGMVGISQIDGATRLTLGIRKLSSGFSTTPALLGVFVFSSLIASSLASATNRGTIQTINFKIKGLGFRFTEFKSQIGNAIRSVAIGTGIGILPGIGGITSNLVAYSVAKTCSKTPEKFGTGIIDGIVAPECANNAAIGGAMIPLLALGIPGDGLTALLLGAFELHGFVAGPSLFQKNGTFVYAIFAALALSCILTVIIEYIGLPTLIKTLKVPTNVLMPIVMVLVMVGCFSVNNRLFECWVFLVFSLITYLLKKFKFPTTPLVLGFVLGADCEMYLRRGLMLVNNDVRAFIMDPICFAFIILAVVSTVLLLNQDKRQKAALKAAKAASEADLDVENVDD